ncbi:MAG: endonuclease/exonuclease/phosphatase family protein [Gemmatimonadaceae bacterium]|nr:endonuclease/exonuclease/phosphatase family protein [Gemmatimonadaceae bacterium]
MRRHVAIPLLVSLAACAQHPIPRDRSIELTVPPASAVTPTSLPRELRVVTFNVHMEPAKRVIEGIRSDPALRDADLIILEEVHRDESVPASCSGACGLAKELGFYAMYAPGHATGNGSDGVAIVSRVPITGYEVIELPYFNVHFNSGRRIALAATVNVAGTPVTVYAVHLENRVSVRDRRKQMLPVLAHAERRTTPVIIAGDFNTSPFTWIAHVIPILTTTQDNRLEQLVRAHGFATPVTDSGPTHRYMGMKLDGIYTRGFVTKKFATANARNISDHLALWARAELVN